MIQTGHSNGQATDDEKRVLANTLFFLAQFTTETHIADRSGMDMEPPARPIVEIVDITDLSNISLEFNSIDKGSTYQYYIEATDLETRRNIDLRYNRSRNNKWTKRFCS